MGAIYKQRTTHRLNHGQISMAKYNSSALHRKILVDGRGVSVYGATVEEFYFYIYGFLMRHYRLDDVEQEYLCTFDLDWSQWDKRIWALNELDAINQTRKNRQWPMIQLFADEVDCAAV